MSTPLKSLIWYKKLATKKGRNEAGAFIVEGDRAIRQIITNHPDEIVEILVTEDPLPEYSNFAVRVLSENQFKYICHTRTPQGIMAIVKLPWDTYTNKLPKNAGSKVLILEDIQDPGNVGTLIRNAVAFGYSGVIMTESCADPLSPKCVQASAGTLLAVWIRRTVNYLELVRVLKQDGYPMLAADINGIEEPSLLQNRNKLILALGNEAAGLSKELLNEADNILRIPVIRDKAESLNVASCGAICMFLSSQEC